MGFLFSLKDDDNPSLCSSTSLSICEEKNWEITIFKRICRLLKMNVIAYHNGQSEGKYPKEPMRTQSKKQAQENAGDQVVNGFSFASDWLRAWHEFSGPITERIKSKTK